MVQLILIGETKLAEVSRKLGISPSVIRYLKTKKGPSHTAQPWTALLAKQILGAATLLTRESVPPGCELSQLTALTRPTRAVKQEAG
jgi:hypothetical protein